MNILTVLSGATKLCRNIDSHAELDCLSMAPGNASPPVYTIAQRPAVSKVETLVYFKWSLSDNMMDNEDGSVSGVKFFTIISRKRGIINSIKIEKNLNRYNSQHSDSKLMDVTPLQLPNLDL